MKNLFLVFPLYVLSREWLFANEEILFIFSFLLFVYTLYIFAGSYFSASLDSQIEEIRNKFMSLLVVREKALREEVTNLTFILNADEAILQATPHALEVLISVNGKKIDLNTIINKKIKDIADTLYLEEFDQNRQAYIQKENSYFINFVEEIQQEITNEISLRELKHTFMNVNVLNKGLEEITKNTLTKLFNETSIFAKLALLNSFAYKALLSYRISLPLNKKENFASKDSSVNSTSISRFAESYTDNSRELLAKQIASSFALKSK